MARYRSRRKNKKKGTRRYRRNRQRGGDTVTPKGEKCLYVSFPPKSGLGNLLFVYAAAVSIKKQIGTVLCMLPYTNEHSTNDYRKLLFFKQGKPVESADTSAKRLLGDMKLDSKESHKEWTYTPESGDGDVNTIVGDAYFQNYKGIKHAIPIIRKDFAEIFSEKYPGFKDTIKPTSAFMHVRKGDYEFLLSLNNDYYTRGLSMLDEIKDITDIYIVSDDIEWCKGQGWKTNKDTLRWFDNPDDMKDEMKTMYLMSLCLAGACISASTFSTWGAILGADQNESSTIIYPSTWITGSKSSELMFPERWKNIEGIQNVFTK